MKTKFFQNKQQKNFIFHSNHSSQKQSELSHYKCPVSGMICNYVAFFWFNCQRLKTPKKQTIIIIYMHLLLRAKSYPVQGFNYSNNQYQLPPRFKTTKQTMNPLPKLKRQLGQESNSKQAMKRLKCKITNRLSLQSSKEQQFEKSLNHNTYTLNLSEYSRFNSLPKLKSMYNAHHSLISQEAFEHFKRVNTVNGRYQQALGELQKAQQKKCFRLRIGKKARVKTRKNVFQKEKIQKSKSFHNIQGIENNKHLQSKQNSTEANFNTKNTSYGLIPNSKKCRTHFDSKWKITDFLDSIVAHQEENKSQASQARNRVSFLGKIMRITDSCHDLETENKANTYLKLFSKYSQNLDSNLQRKRKKLDKVQVVFANQTKV